YNVVVRVWNASTDCPVVEMPVHLSYLSFGVGTVSHTIATKKVDVSVKGGANNPSLLVVPWKTPPDPGHYCLQALLDPKADLEFGNNLGQHNTDVVAAHSPATFSFALRNDTRLERSYSFVVDTYQVGDPKPCVDRQSLLDQDPTARHRADYPLPPGWTVTLAPANPTLAPGAAVSVVATVTPPAGFVGSQVVNIHAFYQEFHADHLAGGVTITVTGGP
ncbi:MAG: NEW3 domain-containing protein, partial [Actinomycetota bacterium]|nr:NEW3 domain-containing protein [Actinomycetota bacterium]